MSTDDEDNEELKEKRYCKICGTELDEGEPDICLNCQSAMISSGMV
jgi:hypothetical protein